MLLKLVLRRLAGQILSVFYDDSFVRDQWRLRHTFGLNIFCFLMLLGVWVCGAAQGTDIPQTCLNLKFRSPIYRLLVTKCPVLLPFRQSTAENFASRPPISSQPQFLQRAPMLSRIDQELSHATNRTPTALPNLRPSSSLRKSNNQWAVSLAFFLPMFALSAL
jgi:hypothetical protein